MKKIIISAIVVLMTTVSFAQTSEHLAFKGVPIDGTLKEYVAKMKQNGFSLVGTKDGIAMLNGDFAGYKDCLIGVSTLKQKDLVSKITVIFPKREKWSFLSSNYFSLKEMLTEKYGEPSESVEKFDAYSEPDDDGSKMALVKLDRCKYYAIYATEKGDIELSVQGDITSSFVTLSYYDKINSEKIRAKAIDDL